MEEKKSLSQYKSMISRKINCQKEYAIKQGGTKENIFRNQRDNLSGTH